VVFEVTNCVMLIRILVKIRNLLQKWSKKTHRQHGCVTSLRLISFNKESRLKHTQVSKTVLQAALQSRRWNQKLVHVLVKFLNTTLFFNQGFGRHN